jgi:hypothetical protein
MMENKMSTTICSDTLYNALRFLSRRDLARIELACRLFHRLISMRLRQFPLLFLPAVRTSFINSGSFKEESGDQKQHTVFIISF